MGGLESDTIGGFNGMIAKQKAQEKKVNVTTILFDDEVDTAGSLIETARILDKNGAKEIYAGCTHGILSANAVERIQNSPIKELVITNTIPLPTEKRINKIKVITIAPLFAEAIRRINEAKPIGELLDLE